MVGEVEWGGEGIVRCWGGGGSVFFFLDWFRFYIILLFSLIRGVVLSSRDFKV